MPDASQDRIPAWQGVLLGLLSGLVSGVALSCTGPLYAFIGGGLVGAILLLGWVEGEAKPWKPTERGLLLFLCALLFNGGMLFALLLAYYWVSHFIFRVPEAVLIELPVLPWVIIPASMAYGARVGLSLVSVEADAAPAGPASPERPEPPPMMTCRDCEGEGRSWALLADCAGTVLLACRACGGRGRVLWRSVASDHAACPDCAGDGKVWIALAARAGTARLDCLRCGGAGRVVRGR